MDSDVDVVTEAVVVGDLAVEAAKMRRKNGVCQRTLDLHLINQDRYNLGSPSPNSAV